MATQFKLRRDTAANWTSANPVLGSGEPGYESDTRKLKLGDGATAWNSLGYITIPTAETATTATTATTASTALKVTASGVSRTMFVSATEPAGMVSGDIWIQV